MNQEDYQRALDLTRQFHDEPIGYSAHNTTSVSDKTIIKQNNIIVCQLEIISEKLSYIIKKLDNPLLPPQVPPLPPTDIDDLINKISKIDLNGKPVRRERQFKDKNPVFGRAK